MNDGGSQGGQQFSLTASKGAKGVGSRTALDGNQTIWSVGDEIYVSSEDGGVKGTLYLDPESLSDDKTTATFTGFVIGGDPAKLAYSVFPAPKKGTTIIDLSTIEGGGEVDAPFIGRIDTSDDVDVRFDHVCGVAPIVMNGYQGEDIVITGTNDNIAVKFLSKLDVTKVDLTGEQPVFIDIDKAGQNETESITITSAKGGQMYVPYYVKSNLVSNNDNKKIVEFKHNNDVVNNADLTNGFIGKVHSTTIVAHTMKEDGTTVQNTSTESKLEEVEGVSTAVVDQNNFSSINSNEEATSEETQYFNVSGLVEKTEEGKTQNVVAEAVEVTLPKVELTDDNKDVEKSVEISFTNVAPSTTITIQEEESTSGTESNKSIDNLTIVLPSGTTEEEAKEQVVIEMPNTTVTVKSDDGNILIINEMTAATADKTLVVGADVEIKSLTIKKGNVQVFGKVGEIKRDPQNEDEVTELIIEKGGEVNAVNGKDKITVIDRNRPSETPEKITVSTFAQLKSALESQPQTEITMIDVTADITLTEPLVINKPVQMHLGNNSLTIAENFVWGNAEAAITSNADLYLSGGNIKGCNATAEGKYLLRSTDIVNIYNVSLETNGVSNGFSQINKIAHFRGASSITATKGNAIHVLINKTEKGYLGVQLWGTTQINGSIAFELTCEPVENAFVAVCLLENSKLNGRLDIIKNGYENYVEFEDRSTGGGEGGDDEATSVDTETKLIEAVKDAKVTKIRLTAPITVSGFSLKQKTLIIDPNIFNGSTANAAITIVSNEEAQIVDGIITGDIEDNNKYIIESTAPTLGILNATIIATGGVNAVRVEDSSFTLNTSEKTPKVIPTTITCDEGYALHMVAKNSAVYANIFGNTTINGKIHYSNNTYNCNSSEGLEMSRIQVEGTINGDLTVAGDYGKDLNKIIEENAVIGEEFTTWRTVEVSEWKQLQVATLDKNITNIVIAAPIEVDKGGVNLQGKTLTLKENFVFGNHSAALYGNVESLSNGTFRGSTTETDKYLIATGSELHLQSSMVLNAGGTLNGVKVTDAGCAVYDDSSITVESGKTAVKIESTKAVAGLGMWNSAVVIGNVLITANYKPQDEEGGCWIELNNRDIPYDFGKIYGNVTIDGTNSSTVEIFIPEDKITDYITGNITGSYKKVIAKYEN